jgi:hypothetical protein
MTAVEEAEAASMVLVEGIKRLRIKLISSIVDHHQ